MLSKLLGPQPGAAPPGAAPGAAPSPDPPPAPSTPPASASINHLLSPASMHNDSSSSSAAGAGAGGSASNKRKGVFSAESPRKAHSSPSKVPRTPDGNNSSRNNNNLPASTHNAASVSSPNKPPSASTPRPASLGNLLNATDESPRRSNAPSVEADDANAVDADVLMEANSSQLRPDDEEGDGADGPEEEAEDGDSEEEEEEEEDDDDDDDDDDSDSDSSDIVVLDGPSAETKDAAVHIKSEPADGTAAGPEGTAAESAAGGGGGTGTDEVVNQLQPKKKAKRARRESIDEDLPPPPPPLPTIRIEVAFKGEETLDVNFIERAVQAGYAVANAFGEDYMPVDEPPAIPETGTDTPVGLEPAGPPAHGGAGPMSLQDMMNADPSQLEALAAKYEEQYDKPSKKAKKRRVIDYDLNDPFIDDSDLKIDRPTHIARPKKEGFFVHSGQLELMEEAKSRSKPKVKKDAKEPRRSLSEALRAHALARQQGSRDSPILVDSDADNDVGPVLKLLHRSPSPEHDPLEHVPVDRTLFKSASREAKYLPPFNDFPDDVAHRLRVLRRASCAHRWDLNNKGKFPEHLKPYLSRAGEAAFRYDLLCVVDKEPTDSGFERFQEKAFVTALCSILPYNKLTLGKLVMKLCYPAYWSWLKAREEEGIRQWKEVLEPEIPAMIEAHEQEVAKAAAAPGKSHPFSIWRSTNAPTEEEITEDGEGATGSSGKKPGANEIKKVPAFTQDMKDIFRQLVENTQEQVDINKKMEDWNQQIQGQASELNMRKFLYNRIISMYPEGYMTTLALSRAFTNFKRAGQGAKAKEEAATAAATPS